MKGVDARHGERGGLDVRAFEWFDVKGVRLAAGQQTLGRDFDQYRRDFEQGIFRGIKPAGFDVDDDRKKAAESASKTRNRCAHVEVIRQRIFSLARMGTTTSLPNAKALGTDHSSRRSVIVPALRGIS